MEINLQRVTVKLYLEEASSLSPQTAFRIFNRWIGETSDEVLIDVADYAHVPRGPQTLLVGHEADYSLDTTDGAAGLRYTRKRPDSGDTQTRLRNALSRALAACQRLEEAPETEGLVRFGTNQILLSVRDRLHTPNTQATLAALRPDLEAVLSPIYDNAALQLTQNDDTRQCFTVDIRAAGDHTLAQMAASLAA